MASGTTLITLGWEAFFSLLSAKVPFSLWPCARTKGELAEKVIHEKGGGMRKGRGNVGGEEWDQTTLTECFCRCWGETVPGCSQPGPVAQVKPGVSPSDQTTLSLWILQHLLSYPEAALWLDVQHGENSLVQNRVSYGFSAVSVGRHLYRKSRWIPYYKRCVCSGKAFDLTHSLKDTQQWHICGVTCDTWARRSFIASLAVSQWRPRILSNLKIRTCDRKQMSVSLNEHFSFY